MTPHTNFAMKPLAAFLLAMGVVLLPTAVAQLAVGDEVCMEGYIMDTFCIERGTLLDNSSFETLVRPDKHSIHCLVDVGICVNSGYEVLIDPEEGQTLYQRGLKLDEKGTTLAADLAREVGEEGYCDSCTGEEGSPESGFRATVRGIVTATAGEDGYPPEIETISVGLSSEGCADADAPSTTTTTEEPMSTTTEEPEETTMMIDTTEDPPEEDTTTSTTTAPTTTTMTEMTEAATMTTTTTETASTETATTEMTEEAATMTTTTTQAAAATMTETTTTEMTTSAAPEDGLNMTFSTDEEDPMMNTTEASREGMELDLNAVVMSSSYRRSVHLLSSTFSLVAAAAPAAALYLVAMVL